MAYVEADASVDDRVSRQPLHAYVGREAQQTSVPLAFDEQGKPVRIVGKEILDILDAHTEPTPLAPGPVAATVNYFIYIGTIPHGRIIEARRVEYVVEGQLGSP